MDGKLCQHVADVKRERNIEDIPTASLRLKGTELTWSIMELG